MHFFKDDENYQIFKGLFYYMDALIKFSHMKTAFQMMSKGK